LQTKLHRPVVLVDFLCRPRLHEILDQALDTSLTLVSAPAGYGKSLLVSHWIETQRVRCAWLSLDGSDSVVVIFFEYLLAAVETAIPDACPQTRRMVEAADPPTWSTLIRSFTNELDALGTPLVVVLDDYHRIQATSEVQEFLRQLLAHPPRSLHLVILTRRDPPFDLTLARAKGALTEVRLQDLQFTVEETRTLLQEVLGLVISEEALASLQREIEGWAVGLKLVFLALRGVEDYNGFLKNLHGGIQLTQNYLLQEVIAGQPPLMRDWLLRTSILERMCADLCNAVASPEVETEPGGLNGVDFARTLKDCNLFTIALDRQGMWFRYHHLFQDLLQAELAQRAEPDEIAELHLRASEWFEKQGMVGEAIIYALNARDSNLAAGVFERHRRVEQDQDRWRNIEKWLAAFPVETRVEQPGLLLGQAWVLHDRYQLKGIAPIVERLESLASHDALDSVSLGELRFFQGVLQFWSGNWGLSHLHCKEARARIPDTHPRIAGLVEIYLALASYLTGQGDKALEELNDRIGDASFLAGALLSRLSLARSLLYMLSGDLLHAAQDAVSVARISRQGSMAYMEGWGRYMEGASRFRANDLEAALSCFKPSFDHRYSMHTRTAVDAMVALALTYQARQQPDAAEKTIANLLAFTREIQDSQHLSVANSGHARLALAQGDIETASRWLRSFDEQPFGPAMFIWLEVPSVTQARVLVATASDESLELASELLARLRSAVDAQQNVYQIIDILVLETLVLDKQGRTEEAFSTLTRALTLAEPGGWIRPFLEPGRAMAELLQRLGERLHDRAYVDMLLSAFPNQILPVTGVGTDGVASPNIAAPVSAPVEILTNREQQILELLGQRLRDKEIAARLSISTQTVNFHLKNIYRKLDVSNRREAAAKASGR
jgi:LuxR family maltose regulon positive regulatory protein